MLVEIEPVGYASVVDGIAVVWKRRGGDLRCALGFNDYVFRGIWGAVHHESYEGVPILHGSLLSLLTRLNVTVECMFIPEIRGDRVRALVRFRMQDTTLQHEMMPSDAVAVALWSKCRVLMDEGVLEKLSRFISPELEIRGFHENPDGALDEATRRATGSPPDDLPKA